MPTTLLPALAPTASPAEEAALTAVLTEGEAQVSDAPLFQPTMAAEVILVFGPKEPTQKVC
ncbi:MULTISPECIES: hypothetical protein [Streptomyces]|uniref:Uncharacterized protein n=1 Tax=Streptomyces fimbriatus TaxID=68197 RepID=A0ABW0DDS2_STRFI